MTKISKKSAYPVKIPVRKDYFVGTDSENNGKTVNFDFESTARLINDLNGTPILNYIFRTDSNIDLTVLTEGVFLSAGNETTITSISKLYINKNNFHETDMSDLFRFIAINREAFSMKLRNSSNLTNAVYFKITGATEYESYFILDVAIDINNSAVPELINFNVYFFDFELSSSDLAITLPEFNKIITETGFTSTETQITFNPLWVWLIKNVSYSNTTSVTKTTTPTTLGSKRIDVFVLNSSNTFQTISGAETTGSPVKPTIPLDTLEVTFCIVGDGGIETVEPINIIDYATIVYVDSKDVLKVDKISGYSLTKNDLTDLLKTTYDNAVNWISVNGSNLLSHILRTDNPHNVTATQVGAPSGSGTSTGTNTGDQDLSTKVDKVTGKSLISDTEITRLAGVSNVDISGKENIANKQNSLAVDGSNTKYPTVTAVNTGLANKIDIQREKIIYSTNFSKVSDLMVNGSFTLVSTGLKSPPTGTFGSTYVAYPKRTSLEIDVTRTLVTINNVSSVFGIIRKPYVSGIVGGTKASINGSANTITIYKGWDGTDSNPGASVTATIPFSLAVGKQYLLELRKVSASLKTFSITDVSSQQTFFISANNEIDWAGSGWDYPALSFESGDITFNKLDFASELPSNSLVMISGDSYTEGSSVYNLGLGSYNKRWDKLVFDNLQGNAIISGKGGDTALDLLNRNDIDFFKSRYHIFLIGANDNNYSTWKTSYDAFIVKILANGQIPILVTIPPREDRQVFINTANTYIKSLGYKVVNFAKALSLNNDEVTLNPDFYLPDNVHPNLAGHIKLFNQLKIDFPILFEKDNAVYNTNNYGSLITNSENNEGIIVKDGIANQTGRMRMNNGRFNIFSFDDNTSAYLPIVLACNAANPSPPPTPTGRVLIGTIIDNGIDLLQLNGSVSISAATGGNSLRINRGTGGVLFASDINSDAIAMYNKSGSVLYQKWKAGGGVQFPILSGAGNRTVVADASGNLSTTEQVFTGSSSLNFPSTPAGQSNELSFSVSGASDGDLVILGVPSVSENANSCYTARISSANTVAVKFNNYSALAIDPAVGTFKVKVLK